MPYISDREATAPFYELFKAPSYHLLHLSNVGLEKEMIEKIERIFPFPIKIVEYNLSESWRKLGVTNTLFILVRPDNYIAYLFDSFQESEVENYLKKYFYSTS